MGNPRIAKHNAISNILLSILTFFFSCLAGFAQANGNLQTHFIDVGQGDGALLISPLGETVLFDDGVKGNCAKPVAYLAKVGLTKIDYHITSHYHADHIGCAVEVLGKFPVIKAAYDRGGSYNSKIYKDYLSVIAGKRTPATGEAKPFCFFRRLVFRCRNKIQRGL